MKSTSSSRTEGPFFEDESYALRLWRPTTGASASGDFGAEDEVGEADLLLSPLDLVGRGRRVVREDRQRVRGAERSRGVSGGGMNVATASPMSATCCEGSTSRMAPKSRTHCLTSARTSAGISASVDAGSGNSLGRRGQTACAASRRCPHCGRGPECSCENGGRSGASHSNACTWV